MVFVLCIWYLVFTLIIQVTEIMKAFKILTSIEQHTASKPSDHGASTTCLVLLKSVPPHPSCPFSVSSGG